MTKTRTVEQMKTERRALDREIRAAQRAEQKARKEHLQSERHALGDWLAQAVGADTIEAVTALQTALNSGQVLAYLRQAIATGSPDTLDVDSNVESVTNGDTDGGRYADAV